MKSKMQSYSVLQIRGKQAELHIYTNRVRTGHLGAVMGRSMKRLMQCVTGAKEPNLILWIPLEKELKIKLLVS